MYGWTGGLGSPPIMVPPIMPGNKDCGGGLSVRQDLACPPPPAPYTREQQAAVDQNMVDRAARLARCQVYEKKEYAIGIAAGLAVAFLAPGIWKLLAIPAALVTDAYYPRSADCDYGW